MLFLGASCVLAHAQGTVYFYNFGLARVYEVDRLTPLSGPQFQAELLAGPSPSSLMPIATAGFLTGNEAGYFVPPVPAGVVKINSVNPQSPAWVQVDVWNTASGATFTEAKGSGLPNSWWQSSVFSVETGGGFQGPIAGYLTGLGTQPVYLNEIPEPSVLALGALGAVVVAACGRSPRHRFSGVDSSGSTANFKTCGKH